MPETFQPPRGPPPSQPARSGSIDDTMVPDEPPPAYTTVAGHQGDTTLAAGPSRMDFSGPPPLPDRLQANITGVGVGYEPRVHATPSHTSTPGGAGMSPQQTGSSFHSNNPFGDHNRPAPPPQHPARYDAHGSFTPPVGPPPGVPGKNPPPSNAGPGGFGGSPSSNAGPSRPPLPPSSTSSPAIDLSPTEIPTPGRPLLRHGQMLVYPKGHFCHKCGNTGYKANDPSNPHDTDWRKYGKPYNAALAASYKTSTAPNSNPSLQSSANFQRPLPALPPAPQHHPPPQSPYGNLPPPPGKWNTYPGQHGYRPPPPPGPMPGGYGPPPVIGSFSTAIPPPNAIILQPGDPRIGGRPCWNCGGSGREIGFFGFDEGKCYQCRGIGRVF